jgi:hypothetical protein
MLNDCNRGNQIKIYDELTLDNDNVVMSVDEANRRRELNS